MCALACMRVPICLKFAMAELTSMALHTHLWLANCAHALGVLASMVLEVSHNAPACRSTRRSLRLSCQLLAGP